MTDLKRGDRVVLTNKQTGQELPEVTYLEKSGWGDIWVGFDGVSGQNNFELKEWAVVKVEPKLPTKPGSVIVNATIRGISGCVAFIVDPGIWQTPVCVEGRTRHRATDITEWTLGKVVPV